MLLVATVAGAAEPVKLPPAMAELLSAAQADLRADRPAQAVERLRTLPDGVEDHALRHLLLGHAHVRQSAFDQAAAAYQQALAMDPAMTEAGLGLAQVRFRQERWRDAADLLGRYVSTDTCEADLLVLYAQAARELADAALARLLVDKGVLRFPGDARLRQLDLAVAVDEDDTEAVRRAVRYLLDREPTDADLWQRLAWVEARGQEDAGRLVALEAAVLCAPDNLEHRRALLAALLAAGNWPTVLARGRALLAGPMAGRAAADIDLMDLLVRAADAGAADATLRAWIDRVPEAERTRAMQIADARLALRQAKPEAARAILGRLIALGDTDPAVFLWAGHLAEQAEDWTEARTLYDHARTLPGRDARLATLYLARLDIRRGREAEAGRLLRSYLNDYPEDAVARSLLALVKEGAGM
ncbi:MAG: tetratricopeptide repeat protein [Planctomycetes bacterium]|nr:tetratricopeptide repeat protein [Planctomycetota bacterium]